MNQRYSPRVGLERCHSYYTCLLLGTVLTPSSDIQVPQWPYAHLPIARFSLFARLSCIQHMEQGPSLSASSKDR